MQVVKNFRTLCVERVKGFEPSTFCLGSKHSTAELHPPSAYYRQDTRRCQGDVAQKYVDFGLRLHSNIGHHAVNLRAQSMDRG